MLKSCEIEFCENFNSKKMEITENVIVFAILANFLANPILEYVNFLDDSIKILNRKIRNIFFYHRF